MDNREPIRVLTLIESRMVTGPARILIDFAHGAAQPDPELPPVHVTLVTYQRGTGDNRLEMTAREAGLNAIAIPERKRFDISVLAQLRQIVKTIQPDILESRNVKSHFFVRSLGLYKRYPWVAWNHGYTATSRMDQAYNLLDYWSMRAAFRVVTVCRPFVDRLVRQGVKREKITILHNFVKPFRLVSAEEVRDVRLRHGLRESETVILSAGRLSKEKGHADLLDATALLAHSAGLPQCRVVIVGDGLEREALTRQADALGISDKVVLAGFQEDMAPYFAMADILALPSHSEGSPNVVLEAMAAGLPISATRVGGVPEILVDRVTGLLVKARDPRAMSVAISELLRNSDLRKRLGEAARAQAQTAFTPEAYRRRLVAFYRDTLRAHRGG